MPPRSRRLHLPAHVVTAVVVTHDGAGWVGECLAGVAAQTRPPQRVVAVDTGSADGSATIAAAALGESAVVQRPRGTPLGAAVRAGLAAFDAPASGADSREWVWILHDDCAPEPDALAQLLTRAADTSSAGAVAPKLLTWDGRHLQEVGLTVNSSGSRDTGLEPHEVDQGQHDAVDGVLASGTAGLLVRRDVWDRLGGLDDSWAFGADDIDLGWRINAAGARVLVAPRAVVRHRGALATGDRRPPGGLPYAARRRLRGMQVVLANTSALLVVPLAVRYLLESLLRVLGLVVVQRSLRRARDELLALAVLVATPATVVRARRRRRATRERPHRELRPLLAPPHRRWRHVVELFGRSHDHDHAATTGAGRLPVESGPVAAEAESFRADDAGVLRRFVTRPPVVLTLLLVAVALVADRALLDGQLHGGRLLPAPGGARDLWDAYRAPWHPVGLGSTVVAPPALAVLALLSSLLLGKVWLAVDLLVLAAAPLAALSAYAGAVAVTRRRWLRVAAAAAYAVSPPLTAAVAGGRLDVLAVLLLVPLTGRAVAAALRTRTTSTGFGAGLLLAAAAAFAPFVWVVAAVVGAGAVAARRSAGAARVLALVLALPPVLLLPWTVEVVRTPALLVAGLGLPDSGVARPSWLDLLLLHPGGPAQPRAWVWAPVALVALLAVFAGRLAGRVAVGCYLAAVAAALVVVKTGHEAAAPAAVAAAAALAAAAVAVESVPAVLRRRAFGWRQATASALALLAIAAVAVTAVGWLVRGADRPLVAADASVLPVFAQAEAAAPTSPRVLVLASDGTGVRYVLLARPEGLRLGDAEVAGPAHAYRRAHRALDAAVADAAAGRPGARAALAAFGITLVVVRDGSAAATAGLAGVPGLARVPATTSVVYRSSALAGEAVVLRGADAAAARAGRTLPRSARPMLLPASPGAVHTRLAAAPPGRLLVLAEPRSSAWRATLDGRPLAPVTAYGWAQAWSLPAQQGRLDVHRAPGLRGALLLAQAVLVGLALVSSIPLRRDEP